MCERLEGYFNDLSTTVQYIYNLRGIGVSAVYVNQELLDWMHEQCDNKAKNWLGVKWCQHFDDAKVEYHATKTGERMTFQPYGADRIPIKVKYSGQNPWKIVCGYRDEEME